MSSNLYVTYPGKEDEIVVFSGGPFEMGAIKNVFGSGNLMIRTSLFKEIGGFNDQDTVSLNIAWDVYVKSLTLGAKLEVCAEPQFVVPSKVCTQKPS